MTSLEDIAKELRTAIANGEELDDIRDNSGEWVDGYVPVYNNRIIEEWQEMPSDYDNLGAVMLGYEGDTDIIRLMMLDLYTYYSDLFNQALDEINQDEEASK